MNQSFDTELQVVLRSLKEVVLPALSGADKHVVEQLHLSIAALTFMQQRLPQAGSYFRGELTDYAALAEAAADLMTPHDPDEAEELRVLANAGRNTLQRPTADWADSIDATRELRAAVAGLIERRAGAPYARDLNDLVIATSFKLHLQARAWYLPFGFELHPETLPALNH
jgi:hypothetical protein